MCYIEKSIWKTIIKFKLLIVILEISSVMKSNEIFIYLDRLKGI